MHFQLRWGGRWREEQGPGADRELLPLSSPHPRTCSGAPSRWRGLAARLSPPVPGAVSCWKVWLRGGTAVFSGFLSFIHVLFYLSSQYLADRSWAPTVFRAPAGERGYVWTRELWSLSSWRRWHCTMKQSAFRRQEGNPLNVGRKGLRNCQEVWRNGRLAELSGVALKNQATEKGPSRPRGTCRHSRALENPGVSTTKWKPRASLCPLLTQS